jgi:hypothetical protein
MVEKRNSDELTELYLRFRWLLSGLEDLPSVDVLKTPHTEALLADIAQAWQVGAPQPIHTVLARNDLGHANTIRRRLQQLKDAGFIDFETSSHDSRVKLVVPTEQALRYFAEYAALLRAAAGR